MNSHIPQYKSSSQEKPLPGRLVNSQEVQDMGSFGAGNPQPAHIHGGVAAMTMAIGKAVFGKKNKAGKVKPVKAPKRK